MTKPPGGPGGPTHPPPYTTRKDSIFNFGAKIQICGVKIQKIIAPKFQIYSPKTQICGAKIQIFVFLYHQKPSTLYEENSRLRQFDTRPPPFFVSFLGFEDPT